MTRYDALTEAIGVLRAYARVGNDKAEKAIEVLQLMQIQLLKARAAQIGKQQHKRAVKQYTRGCPIKWLEDKNRANA